mgnify:CR=1 FL=1
MNTQEETFWMVSRGEGVPMNTQEECYICRKLDVLYVAKNIVAKSIAVKIADEMFTSGFGRVADRLVLVKNTRMEELGGWGKKPFEDRVLFILQKELCLISSSHPKKPKKPQQQKRQIVVGEEWKSPKKEKPKKQLSPKKKKVNTKRWKYGKDRWPQTVRVPIIDFLS